MQNIGRGKREAFRNQPDRENTLVIENIVAGEGDEFEEENN